MEALTTQRAETGAASGTSDPFRVCLDAIRCGLDGAADAEAWTLSDGTVRAGLDEAWRARAGLDELIARLVLAVDQRGLALEDGSSSTQAWLAWRLRTSRASAAKLLVQARTMSPRVEATRRARAAGKVSTDQATLIATTISGLSLDIDRDACLRAETVLIEKARDLTHDEFRTFASHVIEVVDPDGADARLGAALEAEESRALAQTQLRRRRRGDGTSDLFSRLPDLQADMLYRHLDTLASPRRAGAAETSRMTGEGISSVIDSTPWSHGGPTDLDNGCLLCSFHHHLLHKGEWAVRMSRDDIPEVVPPARIDPRRRPMRHQRFIAMRN